MGSDKNRVDVNSRLLSMVQDQYNGAEPKRSKNGKAKSSPDKQHRGSSASSHESENSNHSRSQDGRKKQNGGGHTQSHQSKSSKVVEKSSASSESLTVANAKLDREGSHTAENGHHIEDAADDHGDTNRKDGQVLMTTGDKKEDLEPTEDEKEREEGENSTDADSSDSAKKDRKKHKKKKSKKEKKKKSKESKKKDKDKKKRRRKDKEDDVAGSSEGENWVAVGPASREAGLCFNQSIGRVKIVQNFLFV